MTTNSEVSKQLFENLQNPKLSEDDRRWVLISEILNGHGAQSCLDRVDTLKELRKKVLESQEIKAKAKSQNIHEPCPYNLEQLEQMIKQQISVYENYLEQIKQLKAKINSDLKG